MLKGYRTIIIGVAVGIIGTIKAIATPEDAANAPTPESVEATYDAVQLIYSWGTAAAIWVMRAVTNSPIFKKEPKPESPKA
jgi:hypothetical protein